MIRGWCTDELAPVSILHPVFGFISFLGQIVSRSVDHMLTKLFDSMTQRSRLTVPSG